MTTRHLSLATSAVAACALVAGTAVAAGAQPVDPSVPAKVKSATPSSLPKSVRLPNACSAGVTTLEGMALKVRGTAGLSEEFQFTFWENMPIASTVYTALPSTGVSNSVRTRHWLAVQTGTGDLYHVTAKATVNAEGDVTMSDQQAVKVGSGWTGIRRITYYGPYMYGLDSAGGLKRWTIPASYVPKYDQFIATKGWIGVKTLAPSPLLSYGKDSSGRDILVDTFVTQISTGALREYRFRQRTPRTYQAITLKASGWSSFAYVGTGWCTGVAKYDGLRYYVGINTSGAATLYRDMNLWDNSGKDISRLGLIGTGWTGSYND